MDPDGRSNFKRLLFRRDWPFFYAFDVLAVNGYDLRALPLLERKRRLRAVMPRVESRVLYLDHVVERGVALYEAACEHDLEGAVAKWIHGTYQCDGSGTSWLKIKNARYSQMDAAANYSRSAAMSGSGGEAARRNFVSPDEGVSFA